MSLPELEFHEFYNIVGSCQDFMIFTLNENTCIIVRRNPKLFGGVNIGVETFILPITSVPPVISGMIQTPILLRKYRNSKRFKSFDFIDGRCTQNGDVYTICIYGELYYLFSYGLTKDRVISLTINNICNAITPLIDLYKCRHGGAAADVDYSSICLQPFIESFEFKHSPIALTFEYEVLKNFNDEYTIGISIIVAEGETEEKVHVYKYPQEEIYNYNNFANYADAIEGPFGENSKSFLLQEYILLQIENLHIVTSAFSNNNGETNIVLEQVNDSTQQAKRFIVMRRN